ncbi:MAG: reverse transcriptase family protein [Elusimicrobiota bacterium]
MWVKQDTVNVAKANAFSKFKDERILWLPVFKLARFLANTCGETNNCGFDDLSREFGYGKCTIEDITTIYRMADNKTIDGDSKLALKILSNPECKHVLNNIRTVLKRHICNLTHQQLFVNVPEIARCAKQYATTIEQHYKRFCIKKKNGGRRVIEAPDTELRTIQRIILNHILTPCYPYTSTNPAHGFLPNRNTLTNAAVHANAVVVINLDLKDAFSNTTKGILKKSLTEWFTSYGAKQIIKLCCLNSKLPQGAPTSPLLLNYALIKLDRKLKSLSQSTGWRYSRYADDLTFSCKKLDGSTSGVAKVISLVERIIKDYGYRLNSDKTRVHKPNRELEVTGLMLNSGKPTISRKIRRRVRAMVHNYVTRGVGDVHKVNGYISYIASVNPIYAQKLKQAIVTKQSI